MIKYNVGQHCDCRHKLEFRNMARKCLICGENIRATVVNTYPLKINRNSDKVYRFWNDECARSICSILFGCETHPLLKSFKNSQYCSSCQQIVRDVNFTYRQVQSFQRSLDRLSETLRRRINVNYSKVTKRSEKTENNSMKNILEVLDNHQTDFDNYSHEELIQVIYTVASEFLPETHLVKEEIPEVFHDEFCNSDIESESGNSAPIHQDAIKQENVQIEVLWNSDNECSVGSLDQGLEEEYQAGIETKMKKEIRNVGKEISRSKKKVLFEKALKRNKTESWSSKLSRVKTKKGKKPEENEKKRGRPRKYAVDESKSKPTKKTVRCTHENCEVMFVTEEKMKIHVRKFHEGIEKPYECSHTHCSMSFSKRKGLAKHIKNIHDKRKKKAQYCKFCGKGFEKEEELNEHNSQAHLGPNPFTCAFCPEFYSNSVHLRMHVKKVHPDPEDLMKPHCRICDKYFSNQCNYNMHLKSQHGGPDRIPTCPDCNRQFSSRGALGKHKKRYHSEERKYTCETCGKCFSYLGDLNEHVKLHDENNKKYVCKVCDKKFASSETCKVHEVTHTNIKEFVCQFCGKAFGRKGNLTAHIKLHSREGDVPMRVRKPKKQTLPEDHVLNFSIPDLEIQRNENTLCSQNFPLNQSNDFATQPIIYQTF